MTSDAYNRQVYDASMALGLAFGIALMLNAF